MHIPIMHLTQQDTYQLARAKGPYKLEVFFYQFKTWALAV